MRHKGGTDTPAATEEKKTAIYAEFSGKVLAYIRGKVGDPDIAEDLCADVFVKVYEKLESYDASKGALSTWIYAITRNTLIDYYRTRRIPGEMPEELAGEESAEDVLCRGEMLETLADALEALDERARDIVICRYYSGMTLREIAQRQGLSYAYVKLLHKRALAALREFFEMQ